MTLRFQVNADEISELIALLTEHERLHDGTPSIAAPTAETVDVRAYFFAANNALRAMGTAEPDHGYFVRCWVGGHERMITQCEYLRLCCVQTAQGPRVVPRHDPFEYSMRMDTIATLARLHGAPHELVNDLRGIPRKPKA